MAGKKAARAVSRFTPDEEAVLDRAETAARARLAAEGSRSIIDQYWDEMDAVLGRLLTEYGEEDISNLTKREADILAWGEERGRAQSMAYAIGCMTMPYGERDLDVVRDEAMRRQKSGTRAPGPTRLTPRRRPKRS